MTVDKAELTVLFVGGFTNPPDGSTGGQLFACQNLRDSELRKKIRWLLLDTTMQAVPPPPIHRRIGRAVARLFRFAGLLFRKPDVVLIFTGSGTSFLEKGAMVFLARFARRPVLLSPRSGKDQLLLNRSRFYRWYLRLVLTFCDRLICQSVEWGNFYAGIAGLPPERVVVIPNWVDADAYDLPRKDPHQTPVSCLYLGWMENHKGIHELLDVISEEREAFADVKFKFAGGGGELQAFSDRVRALGLGGRVDCLGWVDSQTKARLLADADVFVSFSYVEGMPNALLEAAAAGCACIATRAGASDSIIPDREYGILVEPGDRQALGRAMKFIISNPASRISMGASARERVLKLYTVSAAADSFYRVFLDVARR